MEKQKIEGGDKLIAEFIGAKLSVGKRSRIELFNFGNNIPFCESIEVTTNHGEYIFTGKKLLFHSSWDWLHPVIEKISQLKEPVYSTYFDMDRVASFRKQKQAITGMRIVVDIEHAWSYVVEFIKWYNKNITWKKKYN